MRTSSLFFILLVCALIALLASPIFAQDDEIDEDATTADEEVSGDEYDQRGAEEDENSEQDRLNVVCCVFPNHLTKRFHIGEQIDVLFSINHRNAPGVAQIIGVQGYLTSPWNVNQPVLNFSGLVLNKTVEPGQEFSLNYAFKTLDDFEPRQYPLILVLWFATPAGQMSEVFFNETVLFTEPLSSFDPRSIFLYLLLLILLGGIGWLLYSTLTMKKGKAKGPLGLPLAGSAAASGVAPVDDDMDFVSAEHKKFLQKSASQNKKGPSKKKK